MTPQQFQELKSLLDRNFDMVCRIYVEHRSRLNRLEKRLSRMEVGEAQVSREPSPVAGDFPLVRRRGESDRYR